MGVWARRDVSTEKYRFLAYWPPENFPRYALRCGNFEYSADPVQVNRIPYLLSQGLPLTYTVYMPSNDTVICQFGRER